MRVRDSIVKDLTDPWDNLKGLLHDEHRLLVVANELGEWQVVEEVHVHLPIPASPHSPNDVVQTNVRIYRRLEKRK